MLYAAIGTIGLILLVLSVLFDDFLDLFGLDSAFLSTTALGTFVATFGFACAIIDANGDVGLGAQFAIAGVVAVVLAGIVGFVTRWFKSERTTQTPTIDSLIGKTCTVSSGAPAGTLAEISTVIFGHPMTYMARANVDLNTGEEVTVMNIQDASTVFVQPTTR